VRVVICVALFMLTALSAAEPRVLEMRYEPWVDTTKVGDWAVIKRGPGEPYRIEVKEISDKEVICEVSAKKDGKEYSLRHRYPRKPSADEKGWLECHSELEMRVTDHGEIKLGDHTVKYDQWKGKIRNGAGMGQSANRVERTYMLLMYEKCVCDDAPFGGVIKARQERMAQSIKINVGPGQKDQDVGSGIFDTVFEMLDFGKAPLATKQR
jgi:hypothetical protein